VQQRTGNHLLSIKFQKSKITYRRWRNLMVGRREKRRGMPLNLLRIAFPPIAMESANRNRADIDPKRRSQDPICQQER
jgi:hypothetical protein